MAILLQVGSAMHRGTIRRYIDTISGSSLRPAVSAVSLADSALLDPIELTQILRPHSLALVLSLLLSSSFSLLSPPLSLPPVLRHVAFIHSRMLAFRSFLSVPSASCSFRSFLPSSSRPLLPSFPFPSFSPVSSIHSLECTLSRCVFFLSPLFFFFFFNSSRVMSVALYVKKFARM